MSSSQLLTLLLCLLSCPFLPLLSLRNKHFLPSLYLHDCLLRTSSRGSRLPPTPLWWWLPSVCLLPSFLDFPPIFLTTPYVLFHQLFMDSPLCVKVGHGLCPVKLPHQPRRLSLSNQSCHQYLITIVARTKKEEKSPTGRLTQFFCMVRRGSSSRWTLLDEWAGSEGRGQGGLSRSLSERAYGLKSESGRSGRVGKAERRAVY